MKISIYKPTDVIGLRNNPTTIEDDLTHVTFEHDGHRFDVSLDSEHRLILRERNGHQLQVLPVASNTVQLCAVSPFDATPKRAKK